jgi:hypothetical protein
MTGHTFPIFTPNIPQKIQILYAAFVSINKKEKKAIQPGLSGHQALNFGLHRSKQKQSRQRNLITIPKFQFSLLLGLIWQLSTKQTKYNEGCLNLNYLLAEVE